MAVESHAARRAAVRMWQGDAQQQACVRRESWQHMRVQAAKPVQLPGKVPAASPCDDGQAQSTAALWWRPTAHRAPTCALPEPV